MWRPGPAVVRADMAATMVSQERLGMGQVGVTWLTAAKISVTSFDTSGFVNSINGTFGWSLDATDHNLSLTYTPIPVPEPGTLALVGVAAARLAGWRRQGQPSCRPSPGPS
jgi:hypothetical protein